MSTVQLEMPDREDALGGVLYAGGLQSLVDVHELLAANPEVDRVALRDRAARFGLERELERVLE